MIKAKFTIVVQKEENWYVATCLENNIASQGKSIEEAMDNIKEALELYYEDMPVEENVSLPTFVTTMELAL